MKLTRREFLSMGGYATAGAVVFVACGIPERELIVQSPVELPEDLVRGEDAWYATTWGDGTNGDGLIVRVMQGRAKKVAGNPDFPVNLGKQSGRYDSALQFLYHPDRISEPLIRRSKTGQRGLTSWGRALTQFNSAIDGKRVTVVTNPLRGHLGWVAGKFAEQHGGRHIMFDPLEQGVLHRATSQIFDTDVLPDFDIGNAHTVLSFGADWLGTWISPVRFGVKYGEFRGGEERGYLIHTESRMSMTAANADLWLGSKPGTEGDIALAIANVIIDEGLASRAEIDAFGASVSSGTLNGYQVSDVAARAGVSAEKIVKAARRFAEHRPSVAFGGGSAGAHTNGSFNLRAIYALNTLVSAVGERGGVTINPTPALPELSGTASGAPFEEWERELAEWRAGNVDTVIIRGVDLVHGMPDSVNVVDALNRVPNVITFGAVLDDTMMHSDLALPEKTFLEEWGTDVPEPAPGYQVVGFQQPVVGPTISFDQTGLIANARSFGDMLLAAPGTDLGVNSMEALVRKTADDLFNLNRRSDSVDAPNSSLFMTGILQRGGWWDTGATKSPAGRGLPDLVQGTTKSEYSSVSGLGTNSQGTFFLVPFQSNGLLDGRLAATPWAQQSPDPMSSATWTTWAEINNEVAKELNIDEADVLLLRTERGELEVLAYPHPGVPPAVIGVPIGYGFEANGRYAEGVGVNVLSVLVDKKDEETGALAWGATRVQLIKANRSKKIPKFEGGVEARPAEPGVPVLVVAPGETAHEAEEHNEEIYRERFLDPD